MRRSSVLVLLLCAVLAVGSMVGCDLTPAERMGIYQTQVERAERVAQAGEDDLAELSRLNAELQEQLRVMIESGQADLAAKVEEALSKVSSEITRVNDIRQRALEELEVAKARIVAVQADGEVDAADEVEVYSSGASQIARLIPVPYADLAGLAIAGLGGLIANHMRRKKLRAEQEADEAMADADHRTFVSQELVASVRTLLQDDWHTEEQGKEILKKVQSRPTREFVQDNL